MKILPIAFLALATVACSSSPSSTSTAGEAPPSASEILKNVEDVTGSLKKTLTSLEILVEGRTDVDKARQAYWSDLAVLDAHVQRIRDRAADLRARRDVYLKDWLERSSGIQKSTMKETAEKRRTELMIEFMTLGAKGSEVRQAFAPLHAGLKDCARFLESDATVAGAKSLAPEYESIRKMEPEVTRTVTEYVDQLRKIGAMLAPK
jgi:hypothetical protein